MIVSCNSADDSVPPQTKIKNDRLKYSVFDLPDYKLVNSQGINTTLKDIIPGEYALLITYTDLVCRPCIENYFSLLNQLPSSVDPENIILITITEIPRTIWLDSEVSGFMGYCLSEEITTDEIKGFIEEYPRLILVDSSLNIISNRYGFAQDSVSNPDFQNILEYLR